MDDNIKERIFDAVHNVADWSKEKAPNIGIVAGIGGFFTSIFLVGKATPKIRDRWYELEEEWAELEDDGYYISKPEQIWEKTKAAAPLIGPGLVTAGLSTFAVVKSFNEEAQRLSTLSLAYDVLALQNKRKDEEIEKLFGLEKRKEIDSLISSKRDEDERRARENDTPCAKSVYLDGKMLFQDPIQKSLYFYSTKEDMQKVLRQLSERFNYQDTVSYNDWCYEIDEPGIGYSGDELIWTNPKDIDIRYGDPGMTQDGMHVFVPIIFWREPKKGY